MKVSHLLHLSHVFVLLVCVECVFLTVFVAQVGPEMQIDQQTGSGCRRKIYETQKDKQLHHQHVPHLF